MKKATFEDDNYRHYLPCNVLEAAQQRIDEIYNNFDSVVVAFSGGKDSLVVLKLVEMFHEKHGIKAKPRVLFRDEELIPDDVIQFVQGIRASGAHDFRYFCLQLQSEKYVLGRKYSYIQWDANRRHLRPMPDFAITSPTVMDQYSTDDFTMQGMPGRVCILTGIRAQESLIRLRAIVNKKNKTHIAATSGGSGRVSMGRPIYDWSERDVFKFFDEHGIKYCPIYDAQVFNGEQLRVSTPLHAERAKRFWQLRTLYPQFYQQIVDIFPEMLLQDRYFSDLDRTGIIFQYPKGWHGIRQYIMENVSEEYRALALERVREAQNMRARRPADDPNFGGYPLLYVFKQIVGGNFKRVFAPRGTPGQIEVEYERQAEAERRASRAG